MYVHHNHVCRFAPPGTFGTSTSGATVNFDGWKTLYNCSDTETWWVQKDEGTKSFGCEGDEKTCDALEYDKSYTVETYNHCNQGSKARRSFPVIGLFSWDLY
jgi:hypothetical protein